MDDASDDELLQIDNRIDTFLPRMATASDFQRLSNGISTNITKLTNNTSDYEGLVRKLGTPEDSEPLRERYHRLQLENKSLMQQTNSNLEQLRKTVQGTAPDQRQKSVLLKNLSEKYLATINRFQEAQRNGARKEKESLERVRAASYRAQDDSYSADNDFPSPIPPPQQQQQQQIGTSFEQAVNLQALEERGQQLHQVEQNIVELNELCKDVFQLVHEHGEIIENISDHTEETVRNVQVSNEQLTKAVSYQSAARRKKILIVMILIIILIILVMGMGLYFGLRK